MRDLEVLNLLDTLRVDSTRRDTSLTFDLVFRYCCGVVHFGPLAMGPPGFLHGGNSAAALDTLCGVFLNGIVENFATFDQGEIDMEKWVIGGNRTVKFDLTYR